MFKETVMQVLHLVALALKGSNVVVLGRVVFEVVQYPGENEVIPKMDYLDKYFFSIYVDV